MFRFSAPNVYFVSIIKVTSSVLFLIKYLQKRGKPDFPWTINFYWYLGFLSFRRSAFALRTLYFVKAEWCTKVVSGRDHLNKFYKRFPVKEYLILGQKSFMDLFQRFTDQFTFIKKEWFYVVSLGWLCINIYFIMIHSCVGIHFSTMDVGTISVQ